jgi:hypothetical protein
MVKSDPGLASAASRRPSAPWHSHRAVHLDSSYGALSLSRVCFPWPPAKSVHAAYAAASTLHRARRFGLVRGEVGKKVFDGFADCVAFGYADSLPERLAVCSDWCAWLWFLDDELDTNRPEIEGLPAIRERMERALDALRRGTLPAQPTPFLEFTAALRSRLIELAPEPESWLERFCQSVSEYLFRGALLAAENWARGAVPTLESYLVQREYDSSMHACLDLVEVAAPCSLPEALYTNALVQRARQLAARVVGLVNDIFSFEREVLVFHNPNNLLCVLMEESGPDLERALGVAFRIVNADVAAFLDTEALIQRQPWAEHPSLAPYLRGMRLWMQGNYTWSLACDRYASPTSPFAELRRGVT